MNNRPTLRNRAALLLLLSTLNPQPSTVHAQASSLSSFTYQGRLNDANGLANGLYDFAFGLFTASTGGSQLGTSIARAFLPVTNGLFTVSLEFLDANSLSGADRWLEIAVHRSGVGTNVTLSPRQQITAAPYAITAGNVISGGLASGTYSHAVTFNSADNNFSGAFTGNGANVTNVNAAMLGGLTSAGFWRTNGNAGANPTNGTFLGTTDNLPLEFKVNGVRALRLEPNPNSPNVVAGSADNGVASGVYGAVIAGGGGVAISPNRVEANFASVLGGLGNTAAGSLSTAMGIGSFAGGEDAIAIGRFCVAGGDHSIAIGNASQANGWVSSAFGMSTASGNTSTAMGYSSTASGTSSLAAGHQSAAAGDSSVALGSGSYAGGDFSLAAGYGNAATNAWATALGGAGNTAGGQFSFAAGRRAKALHTGAFVWADAIDADFPSSGTNQFLIRAGGGVGINNNNPNGAALAVNGNVTVEGIISANGFSAASATTPEVITPKISTAGNVPLEFYVNNLRALRLEPNASSPNVIGGYSGNIVSNGVVGAFIGGGGAGLSPNRVSGNFAAVLGGDGNLASSNSAVAMGHNSTASGKYSTAMGTAAIASGFGAAAIGETVNSSGEASLALGGQTTASGDYSTAMGYFTTAIGLYSTAMGGHTIANGFASIAAGYYAQAAHQGAFVWADASSSTPFASTVNNQFLIRASGGVGIGTANPQGSLHIYSDNNPTVVRVQSSGTPGFGRLEFVSNPQGDINQWRPSYMQSTDNGGFVGGLAFCVNGAGAGNKFGSNEVMRVVNGAVGIGTTTPVSALQVVGTVTATAFNPPSDRNLKENFAPVSPREVLEKVVAMPISRWNFIGDGATPHVGPMAQDFHAAFRLGTDDRHIATVDADGVALAAIQGLNQKLEAQRAENAELNQTVQELKRLVETLVKKGNGL